MSVSVADKPAAPGAGGTQVGLAGIGIRDSPREGMEGQAGCIIFPPFFTLKIFLFLQRIPIIWLLMGPEADISLGAKLELSFCFQGLWLPPDIQGDRFSAFQKAFPAL